MSDEFDQYQPETPTFAERQEARRRSQARTRKIVIWVAVLLCGALVADVILEEGFGCYLLFRSRDRWEMLIYRNDCPEEVYSEVLYSGHVTRDEVEALAASLRARGLFAGPQRRTVVLSRTPEEYVVSFFFIHEKHFNDPDMIRELKEYRAVLSAETFGGRPVAIQMCEPEVRPGIPPRLKVRKVIR